MTAGQWRGPEPRPETARPLIASTTMTESTDIGLLARRHEYGLLVTSRRADDVVVSQVFTTLASAERKVQRAQERGLDASVTLVRIVPVAHVGLEDLALVDEAGQP